MEDIIMQRGCQIISVTGCESFDFGFVVWDFGLERDGLIRFWICDLGLRIE